MVWNMIQDITAIYHNEYKEQSPSVGDYIMFADGRSVLMKKDSEVIEYLRYEELDGVEMSFRYLFFLDTEEGVKRFFLGESQALPENIMEKYSFEQQNIFREKSQRCLLLQE